MMKWILILSLVMNGILGWKLLQKKEIVREEVVEKVVVKKAAPQIIEKKVIVEVPKSEENESRPLHYETDEVEIEDTVQDTNKTREDFLVGRLGFTEKEFKQIEAIKQRYMERFSKVVPKQDEGPMSLAQRKAALQLEEEREAELARTVGEQKWKEWTKFRDDYNSKLFKRAMKQQSGVIVPMEI